MADQNYIIAFEIERLLTYAQQKQLITKRDIIFLRNQYYAMFEITQQKQFIINEIFEFSDSILDNLHACIKNSTTLSAKFGTNSDLAKCRLMSPLIPMPSIVEHTFSQIHKNSGMKAAILYFYKLSQASNYIKTQDMKKNLYWTTKTDYATLEITINLAKPEKDPQAIAKLKSQASASLNTYPKCQLCIENEGFSGNNNHPSRYTHRLISLTLNHEEWFFQFSPYAYYNEHSIIIKKEHQDMLINQDTFARLLDFVDLVPDYFVGANSDIPIVGGSILNHDHFQAGRHIFPMDLAKIRQTIQWAEFPEVTGHILDWPLSVIRLTGNRHDLMRLSNHILNLWRNYSDPSANIIHKTAENHNSITVIVRKQENGRYIVNIVLRNNRTTEDFPDGIFHPHASLHHIKKENIGLIEAMGLAILPGRLNRELQLILDILNSEFPTRLIDRIDNNHELIQHKQWLIELNNKYHNQKVNFDLLQHEVSHKFLEVMLCCGVFKNTSSGHLAFNNFINLINHS